MVAVYHWQTELTNCIARWQTAEASQGRNVQLQQDFFHGEPIELTGGKTSGVGHANRAGNVVKSRIVQCLIWVRLHPAQMLHQPNQ